MAETPPPPIFPKPTSNISLSSPSNLITVKLNNENYLLWKAQIMPYLRGQNLFGHIDWTIVPPQLLDASSKPTSAFLAWQQQDQAIMSVLISSLSEPLIAHVLRASSSLEIWDILKALFAANSQARTMQVQLQLNTLKTGSDSIAEYYRRAKLLQDTLAMAGFSNPECSSSRPH
ncbi:hypothetical protein F2P56_014216 [Juglans regia]|uniref:Retrotransposon Copia-like N-terminal domain-containing protein n=1 Tax=Juglans regia TaxID=51240 RepID=A0A834CL01_JUGRE|nr:hypothetical protein F2P56_014216 [Juglans regia]